MDDSDSGRAHSSDGHDDGDPLPLPRRNGRAHLEPRLREPGSAGSGTPFAAFDPADDAPAEPGDGAGGGAGSPTPGGADDPAPGRAGERAAAFRAAVRRATRRTGR